MAIQIKTTETELELRVACEYSESVIAAFRARGGKWNAGAKEWVFENGAKENGRGCIERLFGLAEEVVTVRVGKAEWKCATDTSTDKTPGWSDGQACMLGGYVLASRRGRDCRANLIATLCEGTVGSCGGSVKNPRVAPSSDAIFELEVRRDFAERLGLIAPALAPVEPENPLAGFSDDEIRAEFVRRGLSRLEK